MSISPRCTHGDQLRNLRRVVLEGVYIQFRGILNEIACTGPAIRPSGVPCAAPLSDAAGPTTRWRSTWNELQAELGASAAVLPEVSVTRWGRIGCSAIRIRLERPDNGSCVR